MVKFCCVVSCNVSGDGVEYFKFPVSKALRAAWRAASGAARGAVCAAHFADTDYRSARGARRLRATAVPSVALPQKSLPTTENETHDPTETATQSNSTKKTTRSKKKSVKRNHNKRTSEENKLETTDVEPAIDKEILKKTGDGDGVDNERLIKKIDNKVTDKSDAAICAQENGKTGSSAEGIQIEEKDIEEMITNYQIQTKTLGPEPLEDLIPSIMANHYRVSEQFDSNNSKPKHGAVGTKAGQLDSATVNHIASRLASKLDVQLTYPLPGVMGMHPLPEVVEKDPVFIEVPVEQAGAECVLVLESVQCDVDPGSLMLQRDSGSGGSDVDLLDHSDDHSARQKKPDPISLLTSSDEDEVIFQEPKIDTVEVSDETDEDDRPLQTLIKKPNPIPKSALGMYLYYCGQCNYKTDDESHFNKHILDLEHSTAIQICPVCPYTTASRAQFARHKRKHKDERKYKCHQCNYKARHNMSLMYHMKSHNASAGSDRIPKFTCDKCGFFSDVKSEGLNHIKTCEDGRYLCDVCNYTTRRRSDLKRHMRRRHRTEEDEDFETNPV